MDLKQRKLNKSEWDSIEVPVSPAENQILQMIIKGYYDVNIRVNPNNSLFSFLKVEYNPKMEDYIYCKYLRERCEKVERDLVALLPSIKYKPIRVEGDSKLNSADRVRLERFDENTLKRLDIYEYVLLTHLELLMCGYKNHHEKDLHFHYYTLYKLLRNSVSKTNRYLCTLVEHVLDTLSEKISKEWILANVSDLIERNDHLLKYGDLTLYEHQKEIFSLCKLPHPKLILYMAPTGTGKTLTPLALSEGSRVIFVCAARHVGLALARAAISVNKKVAFAFGCASADDVRLHYFAAKVYTKNKRTGMIAKVDNSVGTLVEIMICDIKSYLPAMFYMLAFFPKENLITYWDEPTITMDYPEHEFHATIRRNWKQNQIPTVVLSSATLPKVTELTETVPDFLAHFPHSQVHNVVSHDCKKSIPMVNKDGFVVLPHYFCETHEKIREVARHCSEYLTLLRYFDVKEVSAFIKYVLERKIGDNQTIVERHFETLDDITMTSVKKYYVHLLSHIPASHWPTLFDHFTAHRVPRIMENASVDPKGNRITKMKSISGSSAPTLQGQPLARLNSLPSIPKSASIPIAVGTSGVYVTTKDAYTLTDGPTIFLSSDVEKIAKFCVQQANIPAAVMSDIMEKIDFNNVINEKLFVLESEVESIKEEADKKAMNSISMGGQKVGRAKSNKDPKKLSKDVPPEFENRGALSKLTEQIQSLRMMIRSATLNDAFVPNRRMHLEKWAEGMDTTGAFTSSVDEDIVADIMALKGVDNLWKVLLMMGIGVFINHENITYTEIMKKLADEQKLYLIIASSDYIYGTNYQFCHGFLSKDLDLTQEKIIQAMGRVGRNNIQQNYTVRFRDDTQIFKLFTSETEKPEILNMNCLFHHKKVVYREGVYLVAEEEEEEEEQEEDCYGTEEESVEEDTV